MNHDALPLTSSKKELAEEGTVTIENLYLIPDPDEGDEDEFLGTTYTAHLYDPDNEPAEIAEGPVGAVPFKMTQYQALVLRARLNEMFA